MKILESSFVEFGISFRVLILAPFFFFALTACDEDEDNPDGSLPELWVSSARLQGSARADWIFVEPNDCSVADNCSGASGWRRVIRFSTEIQNRGDGALVLGSPEDRNGFVSVDDCRERPVVNVAPTQELIDSGGEVVSFSRARPFCWADTIRLDDMGGAEAPSHPISHQTCFENQGISVGWSSIQASNIDCQLLDITGVEAGEYTLRLIVDPDRLIEQTSREGNKAEVDFLLTPMEGHEVCIAEGDCYVPQIGVCEGVTCLAADDSPFFCEGNVAVSVSGPGICHPVLGECIEERYEINCDEIGAVCRDGDCIDLCGEVECEPPPADHCDGNTALSYTYTGCDEQSGECRDPAVEETDCAELLLACVAGECVDLCEGVECPSARSYCERGYIVFEGRSECCWESGECLPGEREIVHCDEGEVCEDGECRIALDEE